MTAAFKPTTRRSFVICRRPQPGSRAGSLCTGLVGGARALGRRTVHEAAALHLVRRRSRITPHKLDALLLPQVPPPLFYEHSCGSRWATGVPARVHNAGLGAAVWRELADRKTDIARDLEHVFEAFVIPHASPHLRTLEARRRKNV